MKDYLSNNWCYFILNYIVYRYLSAVPTFQPAFNSDAVIEENGWEMNIELDMQ